MRKLILFVSIILIVSFIVYLLYWKSGNSINFNEDLSKARLAYLDVYNNNDNSTDRERLDLLRKNVINKYPNSDAALDVRLQISNYNHDKLKKNNLSVDQQNQILYRAQKNFLKHHPNSNKLLLHLAKLGLKSYPEEAIGYCETVISVDPSNTEAYILCGKAHQILDQYEAAKAKLVLAKNGLIDRLVKELKKKYPYAIHKRLPAYSAFDVNNAKVYLRELGYDVGKDVNYDLNEIYQKKHGLYVGHPHTMPLSDDSLTTIKDIFYLDQITVNIEAIDNGNPIWDSRLRIPIITNGGN